MPTNALLNKFHKLSELERHLAQVCALSGRILSVEEVRMLSIECGWRQPDGKKVRQRDTKQAVSQLMERGILQRANFFSRFRINPEIQDYAVQDSIRQGMFDQIAHVLENQRPPNPWTPERISTGDVRIAFYRGDIGQFKRFLAERNIKEKERPSKMLDPFDQALFDALDPALQGMYLVDTLPTIIDTGIGKPDVIRSLQKYIHNEISPQFNYSTEYADSLIGTVFELWFSSGRLDLLNQFVSSAKGRRPEAGGLAAMLAGDYQRAERCFAEAISINTPASKKNKTPLRYLPAVLYLLLLIRKDSTESRHLARTLLKLISQHQPYRHARIADTVEATLEFQELAISPRQFTARLKAANHGGLSSLITGYVSSWHLADEDSKNEVTGLIQAAKSYEQMGLSWLSAEAAGMAERTSAKSAGKLLQSHEELHRRRGTASLLSAARPIPYWERALQAIERMASSGENGEANIEAQRQRIIWEIDWSKQYNDIELTALIQKRQAAGWSKGRRVAMQRLYERERFPELACMTPHDHAICRTINANEGTNQYGYTETTYSYRQLEALRALVGHPRVYWQGDRKNPLEIVAKQPHLVVTKDDADRIHLSIQPPAEHRAHCGMDPYRLVKEGPYRLAVVFFDERHLDLQELIGDELTIPPKATERVLKSIQPAASLIAVHSDIGHGDEAEELMAGDPTPHIHLAPYHNGLQLRMFVRPFGESGPFFKPGDGAETVVAKLGTETSSALRDLDEERRRQAAVVESCPSLALQAGGHSFYFPSPEEALQVLLELEDLVAEDAVILHWPQGRHFHIAGRASGDQLRMEIRKERDWFAVEGDLQVDEELTLDLIKLIELAEATPSRFIRLDDGSFVALTEQLRQQIDELSAYTEKSKNGLRFPAARSASLADLENTVALKADRHWNDCMQRMREASEVETETPSTLLAELRDYQEEGFRWLAKLAEWGTGACLADDMGLGKTIQALAVLLHRLNEGPALVIAPKSAAFNWQNEIYRFAPTLNVKTLWRQNRGDVINDIQPRDVLIIGYGLLAKEAELLQSVSWGTIILDEAQAIKNVGTQRAQAAHGLEAGFRMILTGTPLENHLGELWNLFQFINPGLLGSLRQFQQQFALPIERDSDRDARHKLKKLIQPFTLRRTKSQVLTELPPRTEIRLNVELTEEERAFYEALRRRALEKIASIVERGSQRMELLGQLTRLRQAACHPQLIAHDCAIPSSKLELFAQTLDELLENQHKVLVFSQFVEHLKLIRTELDHKGVSYQYLDGKTRLTRRKAQVEAFQAGEGDVFLISLKAGGLGLNLTAADYVIHMDPWWNPAVEDQASDRAHRIGQTRPVTVYRLIAQGTVEEQICELHDSKRNLADSLLEGTDMTGKLSTEELIQLIRG